MVQLLDVYTFQLQKKVHGKYQNDLFGEMSEGKQAFVILKLLLDFSDKKCSILID